jgi:hypothetical protein
MFPRTHSKPCLWTRLRRRAAALAAGFLAMSIAVTFGYDDEKGAATKEPETWWSLKPVHKTAPPVVSPGRLKDWVRAPIDQFIATKLVEKGLEPAPLADRRTLLRRVTFDLHGLPPTPEEIDAFVGDPSPEAYEKVVDRLLASPRFGERWARHWMDVIHFAETHGHDQDVPRDNAWPYRDYLIKSFNDDKPYARFVEEQIAGDILFPEDPQATVALGFLAAGPWDESSLKDIREDTIDRKAGQYLDRDDMVTTVGLTFLSTTVQCARCHDHKFDPIGQEEYYGLQAVFAGVDRADRPYDLDPAVRVRRLRLSERKAELDRGAAAVKSLLRDPAVAAEIAAWEKSLGRGKDVWQVLEPTAFKAAKGSTLTKLFDLSLLASGDKPERDTYTIEAKVDLPSVTAIRLEVLTDDSLPHQGPGRQDNGNLHLTEFRVETDSPGAKRKPVLITRALADFNQEGWEINQALDGNMLSAWGIFPAVGKPHAAVFIFRDPLKVAAGTRLTFILEQLHGEGHLIGRARLSATAAPPSAVAPLPPKIDKILAKPKDQRTEDDQAELALFILRDKVESELAALPPAKLVYAAASDFVPIGSFKPARGCRPVHVLRRGDVKRPGPLATPAGLACVTDLDHQFKLAKADDEGQRRAAFARWVSSPKNPLTWRSIANRVWHYHFGRGIVATPNDFGKMGARPTHPELLDWLTAYLLENGGSLKKLQRLIVTSAAYMQTSRHHPDYARIDADNQYLWRMNRTRLDAESLRDAILLASGKIDNTMGGPSVKHFIESPGIHRTPKADYLGFDPDSPGSQRRSVYRFVFRTVPDPFMDALDCPDASQFTPARASSVTALQALALLNDRFMIRMSEHLAQRVASTGSLENQVRLVYRFALGREPSEQETNRLAAYAARHGMANACRLVLNCNEFMFVP